MKKMTVTSAIAVAFGLTLSAVAPANAAVIPTQTIALLAVGERDSIRTLTTDNSTTTHNGSEWYYWNGNSMGFAVEGAVVYLDAADTQNDEDDWSRLSWHIHNDGGPYFIGDGYRLGETTGLNSGLAAESLGRFIFVADTLPAYYPSGPQMDVDVDALDGWTLCWSNVYNDDTPEAGLLSDVWAACDGNYLMYAAGEMVDGDYANFNGSGGDTASTDGLADTGFDSSALVGLSAVLVSLGAVSVIRRRRRS